MGKEVVAYITVGTIVVAGVIALLWYSDRADAPKRVAYTELAQCINDSGAIFYGAFWCPACAQQKNMFGRAAKKLPYEECSTPNRDAQLQVCVDEGVTNYPTWKFEDNTRCTGVLSGEVLAHLSGCTLPVYEGQEAHSVESLYAMLVDEPIRERLEQADDHTPENAEEELQRVRDIVSVTLDAKYGTKLDETTDVAHLLDVISQVSHGCFVEVPEEEMPEEDTAEEPESEG